MQNIARGDDFSVAPVIKIRFAWEVSWFSKTETETIPAPAPPVDRVAALLEQLREIEWQLGALDIEMRQFRTKYSLRTDRFSRIVSLQTASVSSSDIAGIKREWQALLKRGDELFFRRNDVLKRWSELKAERR